MVENSEIFPRIFPTSFQTSVQQDPMVICAKFFFPKFGTCIVKMAIFERFGRKHSQGT